MNDAEPCEGCGGTGIHAPLDDILGMPNGWVQRCDLCEKFEDDLVAMNTHRESKGFGPMTNHPFDLVERDDTTPEHPLRQQFSVRGTFKNGHSITASITLVNDGSGLNCVEDFEEAITENYLSWLWADARTMNGVVKVEVVDCGPVEEV